MRSADNVTRFLALEPYVSALTRDVLANYAALHGFKLQEIEGGELLVLVRAAPELAVQGSAAQLAAWLLGYVAAR